jgi:hypothetical protein
MFKKIALCAMLVLILAPAAVMAAGQQGQAQGIGKEAGNCLNVQQQTAGNTMTQEKSQNAQGQGNGIASQNGDIQKLQTRVQDQTSEQDQAMVRNMTRDQIQQGSDSGPAGESQGTGSNGDVQKLQTRSNDQTHDQDQAMVWNMTQNQSRRSSDSGPAGESRGTGSNGGNCAGDGSNLQKQDESADMVQNRSGITKGNGQNILASFAEHLGVRFRNAGGIFQALGH